MRKRKRSITHRLFFVAGIILLLGSSLAALPFAVENHYLPPEWHVRVVAFLEFLKQLLPTEDQLRFLAWLGGIAVSAVGAAFTLLASWHFAEMRLPQRIEELRRSHTREHLMMQPRILALARRGLGTIPPDIETSRLTLLRKWISWSDKERARILASSANQLATEAAALSEAAKYAQHQQITAHLIRGFQHAYDGEDEKAFDELDEATRVRTDNVLSRDLAAGWARKMRNTIRENDLLVELRQAAIATRADIDHARALRREAELLHKRQDDLPLARDKLNEARTLLQAQLGNEEGSLELGRVLTLFCEVQCDRTVVGNLSGPNGPRTKMHRYLAGVAMHRRKEEPDGEEYGEQRARAVDDRIAEMLDDVKVDGDDRDK